MCILFAYRFYAFRISCNEVFVMKKIIVFFISAMFAVNVCACAPVPKEVQEEMNSYNVENNKEVTVDSSFKYIDVSEIESNAKIALEKQYKQFELANGISVNSPSEINTMKFRYLGNFESNYKKALSMFFTEQEIEAQDIKLSTDQTGSDLYSFWNEEDKMYGCVGDNGFIAMLKPNIFDISFSCNGRNVRIYHIDRGDDLSDLYMLDNGEYSVGEAVDHVNSWLQNEYKQLFPQYDYEVKTVIVREFQDHYLYEIAIEQSYNGVPLDCLTQYAEMDEKTNRMRMKYTNNSIKIQMSSFGEIGSFTNGYGFIEPVNAERIEQCISLESALELCERTFTDFKDITVSDIGIKYTLTPEYDYIGEESVDDNGNITIVTQSAFAAGVVLDSHPVWEFIIDVDPSEFLDEGEPNTYGDVQKYIYVDMVTGEIFFQLDVVLQGTGR